MFRFARSAAAVTLSLFAVACGPADPDPAEAPASSRGGIVGGTVVPAGKDPATVAFAVQMSSGQYVMLCSGTLIGSFTVLTAAHCVYAYGRNPTYYVLEGSSASTPDAAQKVVAQVAHPQYGQSQTQNADLGLLRLEAPFAGVTPIPINTDAITSAHVGMSVRHVGFGTTSGAGGGSGIKREATFPIRQVYADIFESGATGTQTCSGDSGGPGFAVMPGDSGESVIGVVSFGDSNCQSQGWDTRTDVHATWIQNTMAPWEGPTCFEDGKCLAGCVPVDLDCSCGSDGACTAACPDLAKDPDCPANCSTDGVCAIEACPLPDVDCIAEGEGCVSNLDCLTRLCVGDPQHPTTYCSRSCQGDADCGIAGMVCADSACRWAQRPVAGPGDPCGDDTICLELTACNGSTLETRRCYAQCGGSVTCAGAGDVCQVGITGRRFCGPATTPPPAEPPPTVLQGAVDEPRASCNATGAGSMPLALALALGALGLRRRSRAGVRPGGAAGSH